MNEVSWLSHSLKFLIVFSFLFILFSFMKELEVYNSFNSMSWFTFVLI